MSNVLRNGNCKTVASWRIINCSYIYCHTKSTGTKVTAISYDKDADEITLTWTSSPDRTYTILNGTDLKSFPEEIDDSKDGDGDVTTSLTFANRLAAGRQFLIVIQNPLTAD